MRSAMTFFALSAHDSRTLEARPGGIPTSFTAPVFRTRFFGLRRPFNKLMPTWETDEVKSGSVAYDGSD